MRLIAGFLIVALASPPAFAQAADSRLPPAYQKLIDCRAIAEADRRLACFDQAVSAFAAAEKSKELVVFDRVDVRKTQRSLFGLTLPDLNIFGDSSDDAQKEIATSIKTAWQNPNGKWAFELPDGARWVQIDSRNLARDPRSGQSLRLRRGAMGSYLANVDDQIAIRVRRIR